MDAILNSTNEKETKIAVRNFVLRAHYHLMDNSRFWYENDLKTASKILCVIASDITLELLKGN
jgi:hypothetical protein